MNRWPIIPLRELVLPTEQRDPREKPTVAFSYVDIGSVDNALKAVVHAKKIIGAEAPSRARKVICEGDVIVSTVRPNLNAVALVSCALDGQVCSTGFSVLRPSNRVLSGYLFAFTRSSFFVDHLVARTTGANYPAVSDNEVKEVPMPVPPLAEQERIVKLLNEADSLREQRAEADRCAAALIPALFHEMFGDPTSNPRGWPIKPLSEVVFFQEGPGVRKWQFRTSGIKLINVGNIVRGLIDLSTTDRHLDAKEVAETYSHFLLNAGDLVMATSGVTWGKVAFVEPRHLPLCLNTSVVRFRPITATTCNSIFLRAFFETQAFRRQIEQLITGSAQPNFGPSHLKLVRLPLPPVPLQNEFALRVGEIREFEADQVSSGLRLEDLFKALLQGAFSGNL